MVSAIVLFFVFIVGSATAKVPTERTNNYVGPLPKAYGSPLNVDPEVDCAVKALAWEYAKKLQPRVSSFLLLVIGMSGLLDHMERCIVTEAS